MDEVTQVACAACGEVVYEAPHVTIQHHLFEHTRDDRRRWYSYEFDRVVHLCDPEERALVRSRDGRRVALPRWQQKWNHLVGCNSRWWSLGRDVDFVPFFNIRRVTVVSA